jgi:hypothetical protein
MKDKSSIDYAMFINDYTIEPNHLYFGSIGGVIVDYKNECGCESFTLPGAYHAAHKTKCMLRY